MGNITQPPANTSFEQEVRKCCQSTLALILLEHLGVFSDDAPKAKPSIPDATFQKAITAARSQGWIIVENERDQRHRIGALIRHQANYLRRLLDGQLMGSVDHQAGADPAGYEDYLRGVYETHRGHAIIFAKQAQFTNAKVLVDIGCALGAFSSAWIRSSANRSTIMMDLPQVLPIIQGSPEFAVIPANKATLQSIDLRAAFDLPPHGDVYLFSNILHLFDDWKRILKHAAPQVPQGGTIVIFEAASDGSHESQMFDLLVNIRADSRGALIDVGEIADVLGNEWKIEIIAIDVDSYDFFARKYEMVVCVRAI